MPGDSSSPLKDATARLRVLRRENRAAGKEYVGARRPRSPAPPRLRARPSPPARARASPSPPRLSPRGKFTADENQQARKALEAEGVEKSIAGKALKALTRKQ